MSRSIPAQFKKTACAILFIYIWMSTVVQFSHTDDLQGLVPQPGHHGALHYSAATGSGDDGLCAACAWEAVSHAPIPAAVSFGVNQLTLPLPVFPAPKSALLTSFDTILLRGPPCV